MKQLKDIINESLLDDADDILNDSVKERFFTVGTVLMRLSMKRLKNIHP